MTNTERAEENQKAKKRMKELRKNESVGDKKERQRYDKLRRRLARSCKSALSSFKESENSIDIYQHQFDVFQKSLDWYTCKVCNKRQIFTLYSSKPCKDCHLYTLANDLDPQEVPDVIENLTAIEVQLIARIHPVVSLYKVKNVQYKYTGQVINFPQNVQEIATALPHKISDLSGLLTIRVKNSDGHSDFIVNKVRVLKALLWLKENNPFYSDVEISDANLNELPDEGSVYTILRGYDLDADEIEVNPSKLCDEAIFTCNDDDNTSSDEVKPISYKDVPDLSFVSQKDQLNINDNVLVWPSIGKKPINEFSSPGYITMSFPHLFPYGTCDYSNRKKNLVSLDKYVRHLMLYKDGRFAKDPRFRFFMLNSIMRWQALKLGNIYVKQTSFFNNMTVFQLKDYLKKHPGHVKDILFYSRRIRSTKAYWKSKCSELEDMVKQIGPPTIFFTLSSADFHWSELYRLLGHDNSDQLSYYEKSKLLSENPLIVSTFFKLRVEYFLKNTFADYFDVKDIWFRTEFQSRGSAHVHGVVWLEGAPDITKLESDVDKENALDFFSKLVTCQNPDITFRPNLLHPCSKLVSDVGDLNEDLAELVNRVQRHTCSTVYCLKQRNKIVKNCRFGFPKDLATTNHLIESENEFDIEFSRNDQFVNNYNTWFLQTWRSNIDFSPILSERILYKYIAKYASKCEYNSSDYSDVLKTVLGAETFEDEHCRKVIRKLMIKTCAEHDYSAPEVIYLIMGFHLVHASRDFVVINLNNKNWEMLRPDSLTKQSKSLIERYITRPKQYKMYNLTEFSKSFYYYKNKLVTRKKEAVVRLFPRFKKLISDYKDLVHACVFYVPWRDIDEFDRSEEELKEILQIRAINIEDLEDTVLEFEDFEEVGCDEENTDRDLIDKGEIDDVSYLSDIRLSISSGVTNVTSKHPNFNWFYGEDIFDYDKVQDSVSQVKDLTKLHSNMTFDLKDLSHEQRLAFTYFKKSVNLTDHSNVGQYFAKRIIIQGKAGCGKSYLLNCMKQYMQDNFGKDSYVALGPTGVCSRNINGSTLHSFFHFPRRLTHFKRLIGSELYKLQQKCLDLKVIFIDEYSMVGFKTLAMIDQRCREYKDCQQPFGNIHIILLGDIFQLGPVGDKALFDIRNIDSCNSLAQLGKTALDTFEKAFILQFAQRYDDSSYSSFLDRLALGNCVDADCVMLNTRQLLKLKSAELDKFSDVLKICSLNDDVKEHNNLRLKDLSQPIAKIVAQNNNNIAFRSPDSFANGLSNILYLSLQSRVMLRFNLNVNYGLVNGTLGTITEILYRRSVGHNSLPLFIIVKFDGIEGFEFLNGGIPITPIHASWQINGVSCTRVQYPLNLSWSCTIHKSQGLTINLCEIDLGTNDFQLGLTYVALSRVKNVRSILLNKPVTLERLNSVKSSKMYVLRETFTDWLRSLI